mmetsp:Transcript_14993/g.26268  ORF Transcript_14993/g.26268 Transcript_14993/m.26268 type:complete len:165 (+) Transcript_14993:81-575(+)
MPAPATKMARRCFTVMLMLMVVRMSEVLFTESSLRSAGRSHVNHPQAHARKSLSSLRAKDVTQETEFQEALAKGMPLVVDFSSQWCGPCKLMHKVMNEVEAKFEGRVQVLTLQVEKNAQLAGLYGIRKVPTVMFFGSGSPEPLQTFTGLASGESINQAIEETFL